MFSVQGIRFLSFYQDLILARLDFIYLANVWCIEELFISDLVNFQERINAPSWCDRVLWHSFPGTFIENTAYGESRAARHICPVSHPNCTRFMSHLGNCFCHNNQSEDLNQSVNYLLESLNSVDFVCVTDLVVIVFQWRRKELDFSCYSLFRTKIFY